MADKRGYIRIVQQPPATIIRGAPFTFIAYCPKSNLYHDNNENTVLKSDGSGSPDAQQKEEEEEEGGGELTTHSRNGGGSFFATAHVILSTADAAASAAAASSLPLEEGGGGLMVVAGKTRAEFNTENEDDRTMRFEIAITHTGIFLVVVRLRKRHGSRSSDRGGGGDYIVTSVLTRRIQVVDKLDRQDDDTKNSRINDTSYGRLTPPPPFGDEEDEEEEDEEFESSSSFVHGQNLRKNKRKFLLPRSSLSASSSSSWSLLSSPAAASKRPEKKTGGDESNERDDKKGQYGNDSRVISTTSVSYNYREEAYGDGDGESGEEDYWSDDGDNDDDDNGDDESENDGGVKVS